MQAVPVDNSPDRNTTQPQKYNIARTTPKEAPLNHKIYPARPSIAAHSVVNLTHTQNAIRVSPHIVEIYSESAW